MNFNERHMDWLKYHCPFFDSYVLLNSKKEDKPHDCVIDRRFTKLSYQVFSMILEASTPETLEENLRSPQEFIKRAQNIRRKRQMEYDPKTGKIRTKLTHNHVAESYRTEGVALESEGPKAIKSSLEECREILFDAEYEDLPLYSSAGWQFCIDLKYNFEKIGTKPEQEVLEGALNKYYAYKDPEIKGHFVVAFGTEDEIAKDCLQGKGITISLYEEIGRLLGDTGELSEDYLMCIPSNKKKLSEIKITIESYGFQEDKRLKNCGWG